MIYSSNVKLPLWIYKDVSNYGIGDGAYSQVYKVKRIADGQVYALKKVRLNHLSDKEKENAINEVRILASIKHLNVISYKEAFIEPTTQSLW
jgi:NIMA (never in mitosis gene a)-related kinase 1/4/5